MALPGNDFLDFLAQKANNPTGNPLQRAVAGVAHTALGERLAEHGEWLGGGDGRMSPQEAAVFLPKSIVGGLGLLLEGGQEVGKAATGGYYAAIDQLLATAESPNAAALAPIPGIGPVLASYGAARQVAEAAGVDAPSLRDTREGQSGRRATAALAGGDGNLWQRLRAANEAAASGNERSVGLANMTLDPTNLIPMPVDELGKLLRLRKARTAFARLLAGTDEAARQIPPALDPALWPSPPPLDPGLLRNLPRLDPGILRNPPPLDPGLLTTPPAIDPALWDEAAPALADLVGEAARGAPTPDPLLEAVAGPSPASYDAFLQSIRDMAELPPASAAYWQRLGLDPATTGAYFARGAAENLLGQTDAGLYAVKPGALARFVPTSTRQQVDAWIGATYGKGARQAWPNLLKKLGAEVTPDGVMRGEQDITDQVLSYLTDRSEITSKKIAAERYRQLLGEIAPVADDDAARLADEQLMRDEAMIAAIEESPYFGAFRYFNADGTLRKVNPITGQRLTVREGGKFAKGRAEVWNLAGSGYDEVAANLLDDYQGGHNQNFGQSAEDFWSDAQEAFREYRRLRAAAKAPVSPALGGDIAAGGGGMGIAPYLLPHGAATTLAGAGLTGLGGAGLGALGGFAQADGDLGERLRAAGEGAITGGMVGAGIGALGGATLGKNTSRDTAIQLVQKSGAIAKQSSAQAIKGRGKNPPLVSGFFSHWAGQTVRHARNIFQGELWNDLVTGALTPRSRQYIRATRDSLVARMDRADPYERLSDGARGLMETFGKRGQLPDIGVNLANSMEDQALTLGREILYSTIESLANPVGIAQSALGVIAGGPVRGAINTLWRPFYNAVDGVLGRTFREAALVSEGGKYAAMGRRALIDGGHAWARQLPEHGMISAREVAQNIGTREAAIWQRMQDNALDLAQRRVKFLFGDYSQDIGGALGYVDKTLRRLGIPFASWAVRAYPVALEMAISHPVIATALFVAARAGAQGAGEHGRPDYTASMLPLRDEAGILTGGQPGTAYLDLMALASPVGGELFVKEEATAPEKNTYQEIVEGLGRIGLPGPNPLVQSLAYIMGLDYRGPNAVSRTQGLENALALAPGNVALPDLGGGALRAARAKVSPLVAGTDLGALLGAEADVSPEQYDPIGRRYAELVLRGTGKPLHAPANRAYQYDLAFGRGALYEQAAREVLVGGALRNVTSLSSPVGVVTQTDTARQAREASRANPITWEMVEAAPVGDYSRRNLELERRRYQEATPWSDVYRIGGRQEAEDLLLQSILDRYRRAGVYAPSQAGIQEQSVLLQLLAERDRIPLR